MRVVDVKSTRGKSIREIIKGFPHQLTEWLDEEWKLKSMVEPFKKYGEEEDGVIVKSPHKWAIFTTGKKSQLQEDIRVKLVKE